MAVGTEGPTLSQEDRDKIIRAAYTAAGKRLREAHHDEFLRYQTEECSARGIDWSPKMTPEEKATMEFDRLVTEFPHLRERLTAEETASTP